MENSQINLQSRIEASDVELNTGVRSNLSLSNFKALLDFTKLNADVDNNEDPSSPFVVHREWLKDAVNPELSEQSLSRDEMERLTLRSTLQELSFHDFCIESQALSREVAQKLEANPSLPGVIVERQGQFLAMISRRRFLQVMSRPYSLDLFLRRPIEHLCSMLQTTDDQLETLILPGNTLIVAAAWQLLRQAPEKADESIVVEITPQVYRLLDVHQILVAQSQIHQLATQLIQELYKHLEAAKQELQHQQQANSKNLLQLASSSHFKKYLDQKWQKLAQEKASLSLILCEVDFSETYSDIYGHQAEDECLQQIAKVIRSTLKGATDLVVRYGGKEFAMILPRTPVKEALQVSEAIRVAVTRLEIAQIASPVSQHLTLSLGVASIVPSQQSSTTNLMAAADQALSQAKASRHEPVMV